jgi:hypothetical protein
MTAIAVFAMASLLQLSPAAGAPASPAPADALDLRGRAICVDRAGRRQACGEDARRFALVDADGRLRLFAENDELARIFEDPRVREKDLLVRARETAAHALEIIKVFSVRGGRINDLRYYCDVCHINAYVPGPCPCCGRQMELVEEDPEGRHER